MNNDLSSQQVRRIQAGLEVLVRALRIIPKVDENTEPWKGKIREEHWISIYRAAHGVVGNRPTTKPMGDYYFQGKAIEFKVKGVSEPIKCQGEKLSHVITRVVEWNEKAAEEKSKIDVLKQLETHEDLLYSLAENSADEVSGIEPVARYGVLLYNPTLEEFLYSEQDIEKLNPASFYAEKHNGSLWIFERESKIKRFSITGHTHGAKIQRYLDVPEVGKGSYYFKVENDGSKPIWLSPETYNTLSTMAGTRTADEFITALLEKEALR